MDRLRKFITSQRWIFAKSYAKTAPHEYIVRTPENETEFIWVVQYIRLQGVRRAFWKKEYIYLDEGGYTYWTMGNPIDQTKVINRAKI